MQDDLWRAWRSQKTVAVRALAGYRTGPLPTRAMSPTNPPSVPDTGHLPIAIDRIRRARWFRLYNSGMSGEGNCHAGGPQ